MRKIAFIGTSCTGKTTTFEYYRKKFLGDPSVAFVSESAREYLEKHPAKVFRRPAFVPWEIDKLTLTKEKAAHASGAKVIICDRSVLDPVAYLTEQHSREEANKLLKNIDHWLPSYTDFLLFDPADVPYVTDEVRRDSLRGRNKVHEYLLILLDELKLPYKVISGTLEERIQAIDKLLNSPQKR